MEQNRDISVREAGQRGGRKTAKTHDRGFYEAIGHKGGSVGGQKGGRRVKELIEKGRETEEGSK